MNTPNPPDSDGPPAGEKEIMSAMFASMVLQQTNMASIFLGLAPHPQTGQIARDLDHARYFIDQLEMIEAKTRGNLDKMEEGLLKQSLTSLRLAFVEAVSKPDAPDEGSAPAAGPAPAPTPASAPAVPPPGAAEDSRKKFTKKY